MKSKRTSLLFSALTSNVVLIVNLIIGLIITPYVIDTISMETYGIWVLVGSVIGFIGLLDLGVSSAVTKQIAMFRGIGDDRAISEIIYVALIFFFIVAFLVVLGTYLCTPYVVTYFDIPLGQMEEFSMLFNIIAISTAIGLLGGVFTGGIKAFERYDIYNGILISGVCIRSLLIIILLDFSLGVIGLGIATLVTSIINLIMGYTILRRQVSEFLFASNGFLARRLPQLLIYGYGMTVLALASMCVSQTPNIILARMLSMESVSVYAISRMLLGFMINLMSATFQALLPRLSLLHGSENRVEAQSLFFRMLMLSSCLAFWGFTVSVLFVEPFIRFWVGDKFSLSITVFYILAFGAVLPLAQIPSLLKLQATDKHFNYGYMVGFEALCTVTLGIFLIHLGLGISGMALSVTISMFFVRGLAASLYTCKTQGFSILIYWRKIIPFALSSATTLVFLFPFVTLTSEVELVRVVLAFLLGSIIFMVSVYIYLRLFHEFMFLKDFIIILQRLLPYKVVG